jgi:hypothetical protein
MSWECFMVVKWNNTSQVPSPPANPTITTIKMVIKMEMRYHLSSYKIIEG